MKYVKKPIPVEAIQWNGANFEQIATFMGDTHPFLDTYNNLIIPTLEGEMATPVGSYVIKGVKGEFYGCNEEVFNLTYERWEDNND